MQSTERLRGFVTALAEIVESNANPTEKAAPLLRDLLAADDFLPSEFAAPSGSP